MEDFQPQAVKGPDSSGPLEQIVPPPSDQLTPEPPKSGGFKQFVQDNKWYIVAITVGLLIIGALAAIAFWPRDKERTSEANVSINIEAPQSTQAGGEVIYRLQILNQDTAKLVNMNLELVYDDGLSYVSSSPKAENLSGTTFKVPDLASGQNAVVIVKALAQGSVNDEKRLVARLRYKFDNFSSGFTTETSSTTRLVAANVIMDFAGKDSVNVGEQVTYTLSYRNTSSKAIDGSRIQIIYPTGFKFGSSEPTASLGNNVWNLGTLQPNQAGQINFQGIIGNSQVGQAYELVAEFLVPDDSGTYYTQSSTTYQLRISSQALSVEAKVSSSSVGGIVNPGATVSVDFAFQNNSDVVHTGLQLLAELESISIASGSIKAQAGFVQDQLVTWNGSGTPALEQLTIGGKGTVRLQFTIAKPATSTDNKNLTVKIHPRIKSNQNEQYITGGAIELKISSPSELTGAVSHVSGQLPPKVASESSFKVRLALKNSSNDYRNGKVTGLVPVGVIVDTNRFTESEKNLVKYDASTGRLTWDLGQLLAHSGVLIPERVLEFTVKTTPSNSQVGQAIGLFRSIEFTAVDNFTQENIKDNIQDLSTNNLPSGQNGRVQQ